MDHRYRLIDGQELYDILADPGQLRDISSTHPEEVLRLRRSYEEWWASLAPALPSVERILVSPQLEQETRLTCHDWHFVELPGPARLGEESNPPWNQPQVDRGVRANGTWTLEVIETGDYEISLSRWPRELSRPLHSPGEHQDDQLRRASALDIVGARIEAGGRIHEWGVDPSDIQTSQRLQLKEGDLDLKATFILNDGDSLGAYYAYLSRLE